MAWHITGDKPLSEPMMALFIDAYLCQSTTMSHILSINVHIYLTISYFKYKIYLLENFETLHKTIVYLSHFCFPCWTKFTMFCSKIFKTFSKVFVRPSDFICLVEQSAPCFVAANLLCIASVPRVPQIGFVGWECIYKRPVQYIPWNMHTDLFCFGKFKVFVGPKWIISPYSSGLLHWHWGKHMIASKHNFFYTVFE